MKNYTEFKSAINIDGIAIERKESRGRKLRLTISPKTAAVIIHIPKNYSVTEAMQFVQENIKWIKSNKLKVEERITARTEKQNLRNGSTVKIWGEDYKLKIIKGAKRTSFSVDDDFVYIKEPNNYDAKKRNAVLSRLYKKELKIFIDEIADHWQQTMKEEPSEIRYRDMKSKWGSCNRHTGVVTLNIRLAALPCECAEMVLVHEFVHFKERLHNARFKKFMTKYLPDWKERVKVLNSQD